MQKHNAVWWQTRPMVSFVLPQVMGNKVAAWGSGAEGDQCTSFEDLPQVLLVIVATEGTGDFIHPHLLRILEDL